MDAGMAILHLAVGYAIGQIIVLVLIKMGVWDKMIDWFM